MITSLAVAVIAIAVAIGSWFRPTGDDNPPPSDSAPQYSEQEVAEATAAVCDAHDLVNRATTNAGSRTSDDPTVRGLLSVNVRVGATVSADYLLTKISDNPASPPELAQDIRDLALVFQETTLLHLSDAPEPELKVVYDRLDTVDAKVIQACK